MAVGGGGAVLGVLDRVHARDAVLGVSVTDDLIVLYTYLCRDGLWRTRCAEHMAQARGAYAPLEGVPPRTRQAERRRCFGCYSEQFPRGTEPHEEHI